MSDDLEHRIKVSVRVPLYCQNIDFGGGDTVSGHALRSDLKFIQMQLLEFLNQIG